MKSAGAVSILLFVLPAICFGLETSYFQDRSASIIVAPQDIQDDSFVYVSNSKFTSNSQQIEETSVADMISNFVGGPVINRNAARQGSTSDKSSANLFVVVDSVGSDIISQTNLESLKGGNRMSISRVAYPQDSVASLTTLVTGTTPSSHGIVGKQWINDKGFDTEAYKAQALPLSASVFDVVSQVHDGRALVVSASADYQMASALAVHQYLHGEHPAWNKLGFAWSEDDQSFANLYSGVSTSTTQRLSLNVASLVAQMTTASFPAGVSFVEATHEVAVDLANVKSTFNLNRKVDFMFFAEMLFAKNVLAELRSDAMKTVVTDNVPDMISFAFSTLSGIQATYGKNSAQHAAALAILDSVLVELSSGLNALYGNNVATEIVFLGQSAAAKLQNNKELQEAVFRAVKGSVASRASFSSYFPVVYLSRNTDDVCAKVQRAVQFVNQPLEVECPFEQGLHLRDVRQSNGTSDDPYPENTAFQIVLWTSIALGFALLGTIIALCTMDVGADSFLYRAPNPKFHSQ